MSFFFSYVCLNVLAMAMYSSGFRNRQLVHAFLFVVFILEALPSLLCILSRLCKACHTVGKELEFRSSTLAE